MNTAQTIQSIFSDGTKKETDLEALSEVKLSKQMSHSKYSFGWNGNHVFQQAYQNMH